MYFKTLILLFLSLSVRTLSAHEYDDVLRQLDYAIEHQHEYIEKKEHSIASLKHALSLSRANARFAIYEELYLQYKAFNTDSAMHYSRLCLEESRREPLKNAENEQRAVIYQAECLAVSGLYGQARKSLMSVAGNVSDSNKALFFQTMILLDVWESSFSTLNAGNNNLELELTSMRDSVIRYSDDPMTKAYEHAQICKTKSPRLGIEAAMQLLDTMSVDNQMVRHLAYLVATSYDKLGMRDSASCYYAKSALSDIKHGVLEHASLRQLAMSLFRNGDISRSYIYIKKCMDDAEKCQARLRTIEMAKDMPAILDSYNQMVKEHHSRLVYGIVFLTLLLGIISFLLVTTYRSKRRLSIANTKIIEYHDVLKQKKAQLQKVNNEVMVLNKNLQESDRIKGTYVTQYMRQCSNSIAKAEEFRHQLLKTALNANLPKLMAVIRDTKNIENELTEFYMTFDSTFLTLFPTFIQDINALLDPEKQIAVPKGNQLTTELRIFALIRLGVSDSEEIASFLRHSVKTVYNYRSKFRNRALGNPALFEENLMKIGLIS